MPKPSEVQGYALVSLIEKRPGCHLIKTPTARALVKQGWVVRVVTRAEETRLPLVSYRVTAAGYAAVNRERPAELHPCRVENAQWVEVSVYPLTGASVALVCGECNTPHWAKAIGGAYTKAADVPVGQVVGLIERQGVRVLGSWYDHQLKSRWPATARRATLTPTE